MTPRTDRAAFVLQRAGVNLVHADEARELETDLREARKLMARVVGDVYFRDYYPDTDGLFAAFLAQMEAKDK
jgi:hypothetical protein